MSGHKGFFNFLSARPRVSLALTVLTGLALTLGLFFKARDGAFEDLRTRFENDSAIRAGLIQNRLAETIKDLDSLRRFFEGAGQVDRGQFKSFVAPILSVRGGIQALEWIPRVPRAQRGRFEAEVRAEGFADFRIFERDAEGRPVAAGEREAYYPVTYVEPLAGNQKALGFDLGSEPIRLAALETARDTGQATATERITLVQETGAQHGFLVFAPVYDGNLPRATAEERRAALRGFALGVFRFGDLLAAGIVPTPAIGLPFRLLDPTAPEDKRLLHQWEARLKEPSPGAFPHLLHPSLPRANYPFTFGGRVWLVDIEAGHAYLASHYSATFWLVLPAGVLLTLVLALYLRALLSEKARAEALVQARTAELHESTERIRALFNATSDSIMLLDTRGMILSVNRNGAQRRGIDPEAMIGRSVCDFLPQANGLLRKGKIEEVVRTGQLQVYEEERNGRFYQIKLAPILGREGRVVQLASYSKDITERKEAAEKLQRTMRQLEKWVEQRTRDLTVANQLLTHEVEDRRRAEAELSSAVRVREELAQIIEKSPVVTFTWKNAEGWPVTFVSANVSRYGYSPGDFYTGVVAYSGMVHPEDRERFHSEIALHAWEEHEGLSQEYRILTRAGETRWVEGLTWTKQDLDGEITRYQGIIIDITDRKRTEEALRESEARTRRITEAAQDAILMMDPDGLVTFWNPAAEHILGYARDEALGQELHAFIAPERYYEAYRAAFPKFQATGQGNALGKTLDLCALRKDGKEIDVSLSVSALNIQGGWHAVGILSDITDRKRAEERIRENQEMLAAILKGISAAIVIVDYETLRITDLNEVAEALFEIARDEAVGWPFDEVFYAKLGARICFGGVSPPKVDWLNEEDRLTRNDGSIVPVMKSTLFVQMGGRDALVLTIFDITERKALERQLTYSQKLESIGQLAAGIAHEINTPIQYVGDNIRFLGEAQKSLLALIGKLLALVEEVEAGKDVLPRIREIKQDIRDADLEFFKEEIPKAVEQSIQGVERVGSIVRGIKKFSHPDVEEKVPYDITAAIENTVLVARNEWKYAAELDLDLDESLPLVRCLPGDFNQVVLNLLVNAAHAVAEVMAKTGKMGRIEISTRRVGDSVELRVSDTGTGIPEENRSKIFNPFFTTKPVGKGTGQGLAITHSIVVKKHQGSIDFESEVGKGTTFIITLPIGAADTEPQGGAA